MAAVSSPVAVLATTSASPHVIPPTGTFTPTAGRLLVVGFVGVASVDTSPTCTASANGILFGPIKAAQLWGGNDVMAGWVADRLTPDSPASMTITVDTPADQTGGGGVIVWEVSGMTQVGTDAIRQAASGTFTSGNTPTVTLASETVNANPVMAFLGCDLNPPNLTPPSGFTEYADAGWATPTTGIHAIGRDAGTPSTTISWGTTVASAGGVYGFELDFEPIPSVDDPQATILANNTRATLSASTTSATLAANNTRAEIA